MSAWVRRRLDRPIAGHERLTVTLCGLLLALAAAGLILTAPTHSSAHRPGDAHTARSAVAASRWRWTPADAAAATASARAFLAGYLPYVYGQAPAVQVRDTTAALVRSLQRERRVVPPGITGLHPHVVALAVSPQEARDALAVAVVSDGEVVHYPVRVALTEAAKRWVVSGLESSR